MTRKKLSGYEAAKEFYNFFFRQGETLSLIDYLDNSFCDEIGLVDLNKNEYKMIYHVEDKYFGPQSDGTFEFLFEFAANNVVHPDDQATYRDLMDPKTMIQKLEESSTKHFRFAHFRYKLIDGTWRWVEQAIITGEENGIPKGVVRFYAFDIQNVKSRELGEHTEEGYVLDASHDSLTGLLNQTVFFDAGFRLIQEDRKTSWAFLSMDIQHFKLFDEWFGRSTGNTILSKIGMILNDHVQTNGGVAGYFGQDDFAVILPYDKRKISELYNSIHKIIASFGLSAGFLPVFGICPIGNIRELHDAFDKASLAAYRAKNDFKNHIHYYDPQMQLESERDYRILLDFMAAMKNDEITFFLQPQCRISNGKIVGAEALARWVKPDGTIVPPGMFIPVLERYGFVSELDAVVWEKVVQWLKKRKDERKTITPVSVNVSRLDVFQFDLVERFIDLTSKYKVDRKYLKIEITESAYAETSSPIIEVVDRLREAGFMVLMDDFGSGYSSLNMLSTSRVDIIKLDGLFLNMDTGNRDRSIHILESIVNMTKIIGLPSIVEGVETIEQVKFLEDLGVRYVQGYYFYRPMPIREFERLIANKAKLDDSGISVKTNEQFQIREFLNQNIYSDTMLNNIIGAVAFYSWDEERIDIVRFNEQFYKTVGESKFQDRLENIQLFVPEHERPKFYELFKEAIRNRLNGASGILHFMKTDGHLVSYLMHFYSLGKKEGTERFYGSANNITELADLQEKMSLLKRYTSDTILFMRRSPEKEYKWTYEVATHGLRDVLGLSEKEIDKELNNGTIFKRIDPETVEKIRRRAMEGFEKKQNFSGSFVLKNKKNEPVHLFLKADAAFEQAHNVEYIVTVRLMD